MHSEQRVIVGQVYPWDVDDALLVRSAASGVAELAIAAHYHAVRAVHRSRDGVRVVQTAVSAAYLEPDATAWADAALTPSYLQVPGGSAVEATARARSAGIRPRAWLSITHHDRPEPGPFSVVDAFGCASANAVCPAWPEVQDFGRRLVMDAVRQTESPLVMIEALAPLGFPHLVAHDKALMAWVDERLARLLSYCFCPACCAEASAEGRDPEADRARIREAAIDPAVDVGELELELRERRSRQAARIAAAITGPVDGTELDVIVSATTDLAAFGSFAPLRHAPRGVTGLATEVGTNSGWRDIAAWRTEPPSVSVAATVTVLPDHPSVSETAARLRAGERIDALTLYHWGSAPAAATELLAPLLTAARESVPYSQEES